MKWNDNRQLETIAGELSDDIEKAFLKYRVNISIKQWKVKADRFIYRIKLKGETREAHVLARAPDVQLKLGLPLFHIFKHEYTIYIVASDRNIVYKHLPNILGSSAYIEAIEKKPLPYVVGYNSMGDLLIVDLVQFPHLLIGGSSNSGKTVSIKALICSLIARKSPNEVNLVLIDVGATDLMPFDGIPHLSCPLITDRETALCALMAVKAEMEERIKLQSSNPSAYKMLPRIVVVIDESPALVAGTTDKQMSKLLIEVISSLLQRGRHAKIHIVIAAQNPTVQNMRVDLGNITARAAFKCAKRNFSETILGESGAENLTGQGDMFFRSPYHDELQRIQGVFITPKELNQVVRNIKMMQYPCSEHQFIISNSDLREPEQSFGTVSTRKSLTSQRDADDMLFAKIVMWALERDTISCNMLCDTFHIGWRRASGFLDKLTALGIAGDMYAKLPRAVLPRKIEDMSAEAIDLLSKQGVSEDYIGYILDEKSTT